MDLQDGMELWLGLFQSAILGRKQLYLNVDVSHKAFPSEMDILDLVCDVARSRNVPNQLDRYQCEDIERFLKGLEITYKFGDIETSMKFNGLKKSAKDQKFKKDDGTELSVYDYFRIEKKFTLKYPGAFSYNFSTLINFLNNPKCLFFRSSCDACRFNCSQRLCTNRALLSSCWSKYKPQMHPQCSVKHYQILRYFN